MLKFNYGWAHGKSKMGELERSTEVRFSEEPGQGGIVFVDRYGPKGPPSLLVGCRGQCEATGYVPIYMSRGDRGNEARDRLNLEDEGDPVYVRLWEEAELASPSDDGWHFVKCPDCLGTGRVRGWKRVPNFFNWVRQKAKFARYHVVKFPYTEKRAAAHLAWVDANPVCLGLASMELDDGNGPYFLEVDSPAWTKRFYAERLDVPHPWLWNRKLAWRVLIGRGRRW